MLTWLHIEGMAPDPIYPYESFDEAPSQPDIQISSVEEACPRRPPTPFPFTVPTSKGTPYIPSMFSDTHSGPPPGQGIPTAIYTDNLEPQLMDYTAGRPAGPHHCPQPFNTEQQWHLPHIPPTVSLSENPPFLGFTPSQCYFCHDFQHVELDCLEPHRWCKRAKRCVILWCHPAFTQLCQFGAE
jgi:hypothetical protein